MDTMTLIRSIHRLTLVLTQLFSLHTQMQIASKLPLSLVTAEASFKNIGGAPFGGAAASPLASLSKPFNTIKKVVR
eukprot:scaffold5844_cov234-Chaetoceros_neogracile.AAC.1